MLYHEQFIVGMRVRFKGVADNTNYDQRKGDTGTVVKPPKNADPEFISIKWDTGTDDPRWRAEYLEILPGDIPDPTNYTEYYDAITEG